MSSWLIRKLKTLAKKTKKKASLIQTNLKKVRRMFFYSDPPALSKKLASKVALFIYFFSSIC